MSEIASDHLHLPLKGGSNIMTISNNLLSVQSEDENITAKQPLIVAQETANRLDLPDWSHMSDNAYRVYYVVALRAKALLWKGRVTKQASYKASRYEESSRTLFVQAYVSDGWPGFHLRGKIQKCQQHAAIDIMCNFNFLCVGEYLGTLGERWAEWRLLSLEVAGEADF